MPPVLLTQLVALFATSNPFLKLSVVAVPSVSPSGAPCTQWARISGPGSRGYGKRNCVGERMLGGRVRTRDTTTSRCRLVALRLPIVSSMPLTPPLPSALPPPACPVSHAAHVHPPLPSPPAAPPPHLTTPPLLPPTSVSSPAAAAPSSPVRPSCPPCCSHRRRRLSRRPPPVLSSMLPMSPCRSRRHPPCLYRNPTTPLLSLLPSVSSSAAAAPPFSV